MIKTAIPYLNGMRQSTYLIDAISKEYLTSNLGNGILLSFQNKSNFILILFALFSFSCTVNFLSVASSCVENVAGFEIVRVDDKNHRYFVVQDSGTSLSDKELIKKLSVCFIKTDWNNDWSVSLFSEKEFAGYIDEPTIIPLHSGNQWAKAYLAEYNGSESSVVKYPALSNTH